ncbi:MAG TPA: hypothetical protein VFT50_11575 [Baekduia sp.]|nr:hypothetical protein [Baekduia sp.]
MSERERTRDDFLAAVAKHRDREWGTTPMGAFDAIKFIADRPPLSRQATPQSKYLLDLAAACLAAIEAEPSKWIVGKP